MFFNARIDVLNAKIAVNCSTDVAAGAEEKGDRLVIKSLYWETFGQEVSIPIQGGYVSRQELDAALRKIRAFR